ncbi:MAG: hypothetical protein K9W46_13860 [Candidatus Heimdallarchaeum endolithica]|uniref:Uncharacterized protein n=1 Tax=Candidatus Heimdallarchaeum endolithica TaxID=2876572 RepID=A0A9Y1BQM0_9ARCH|nr:MAG: hypothetical protein K9W46_13860 [Candidatus Heimdallarchaeum endolithica]
MNYFSQTLLLSQETRTYEINGEEFTLQVDVYYYKSEVWENSWNSTWYDVETEVNSYNYDEYYYYVDNNTGILLEFKQISNNKNYISFYDYVPEYNTYVNFTREETTNHKYFYTLVKASHFYSTTDNSFVPYFTFRNYDWDQPITNSTTDITFPLQFSEDVVKIELYVENLMYSHWIWELVDTQTITSSELNYTVPIDYFEYQPNNRWKDFKIIVYDAKGNMFIRFRTIKDDRYPIPEWQSRIETNKVYKGVEDKELQLNHLYIYSDTIWKVETRFYYNQ